MNTELESIPVRTIDGRPSSLGAYADTVRLVVNVASRCGLTPQYEGLEALYRKYQQRGFEILGFPANEFGAQLLSHLGGSVCRADPAAVAVNLQQHSMSP